MSTTDTHFFTNRENSITLLERLDTILTNNTERFDVLVSFLFATGFYRVAPFLDNVDKIRILVGMGVDDEIFRMYKNANSMKEAVEEKIKKEFERGDVSPEIEKGVKKFIDWIQSKKLEISGHKERNLHAKVYIAIKRQGSEDYGKVITGSSNFTEAGLVNNLEFDVELKDKPDVEFAETEFKRLWEDGVPLSEIFLMTITHNTRMSESFTPEEIYYKTLYEYFKDELDYDLSKISVPEGYLKLLYQIDAVKRAKSILDEHGGVMITDVVGTGKTYVASMLMTQLNEIHPLVVSPPILMDYWEKVMNKFGVYPKVISSGMLSPDIHFEDYSDFNVVIVDEAHNFRNEVTQGYDVLHKLVAGKKVVLVTATPINNKPKDIASLLYLFEDKYRSNIHGAENLQRFFGGLEDDYEKAKKKYKDREITYSQLISVSKNVSSKIRNKILEQVMIRRTRTDLKKYYARDLKEQGVKFPDVKEPIVALYVLDPILDNLFNHTVWVLKDGLKYARYKIYSGLNADGIEYAWKEKLIDSKNVEFEELSEKMFAGLMKTLLVKRLDSSFHSFKKTLDKIISDYQLIVDFLEKKKGIPVSKKKGVSVFDLLEEINLDEEELFEEDFFDRLGANLIPEKYFIKPFKDNLIKDRDLLKELKERWEKVQTDPKINKLIDTLKHDDRLKNNKVLIFSEFADTVDYLDGKLKDDNDLKFKIISVSSSSSEKVKKEVIQNFDPRHPDKQDKYSILISTDILSQGLNLDDASIVINYDIPWNPTRIIQRFGRVNRIGKGGNIYIYNFFPCSQAEKTIDLQATAIKKIEMFVNALGEDVKYLTPNDTVNTKGIWATINGNPEKLEEENDEFGGSPQVGFLEEIRKIEKEKPEYFEKIIYIPLQARACGIKDEDAVMTYFKIGNFSKFFRNGEELTPYEALKLMKDFSESAKAPIPSFFYGLLSENEKSFKSIIEGNEIIMLGGSEKELNAVLNAVNRRRMFESLDDSQVDYISKVIEALNRGALAKTSVLNAMREIKHSVKGKLITKDDACAVYDIVRKYLPYYYIKAKLKTWDTDKERKVVLSAITTGGK